MIGLRIIIPLTYNKKINHGNRYFELGQSGKVLPLYLHLDPLQVRRGDLLRESAECRGWISSAPCLCKPGQHSNNFSASLDPASL